jgi:hypothetical protein
LGRAEHSYGTVLKKILVVDTLIIKEREQTQRGSRRMEMCWSDSHDDDHMGTRPRARTEMRMDMAENLPKPYKALFLLFLTFFSIELCEVFVFK